MIQTLAAPATAPSQAPVAKPAAAPRPRVDEPPAAPAGPPVISPRLRIDTALHLVVMEFRDPNGEVLHSLPTPREIAAYRTQPREPAEGAALDVSH